MELAEGTSLRQLIERDGTLAEEHATEIIRQACAALDEAHRQGVVHRDIKPENILVQTRPEGLHVKVIDFGIAALRDITTSKLTGRVRYWERLTICLPNIVWVKGSMDARTFTVWAWFSTRC